MPLKIDHKPKPAEGLSETRPETTIEKFFFPALISSRAKQELLRLLLRKAHSLEGRQTASLQTPKTRKKAKKEPPSNTADTKEAYESLALLVCLLFFIEGEGSTCLVLSKKNLDSIKERILVAYRIFVTQNGLPKNAPRELAKESESAYQDILDAYMKPAGLESLCKAFPGLIGTPKQATGLSTKDTDGFGSAAIPPIVFYQAPQTGTPPKTVSQKKKTARPKTKAFYFQKYFFYQATIDAKLRSYGKGNAQPLRHPPPKKEIIKNILQQIQEESPLQKNGKKIRLDKSQVQSIEKSLKSPFLVITGGPGTGKTTLILSLLRAFVRAFSGSELSRIALATPTGRSAQRLSESIREGLNSLLSPSEEDKKLLLLEAQTLHSLLALYPFKTKRTTDLLPFDLLVIDEVSMIDTKLFYELLSRIDPQRTRIVLVGDADQLPSVEPGRIFRDTIERVESLSEIARTPESKKNESIKNKLSQKQKNPCLSVLETSHRSDSAIMQFADQIKHGQMPKLPLAKSTKEFSESFARKDATDRQVLFLPAQAAERKEEQRGFAPIPAQIVEAWFRAFLEESFFAALSEWQSLLPSWEESQRALFETQGSPSSNDKKASSQQLLSLLSRIHRSLQQFRILAFTRASVFFLNRVGSQFLFQRLFFRSLRHTKALPTGCPILIRENAPDLELYNGDTGFVLPVADGSQVAFFERGSGKFRAIRKSSLPKHEAAFAHTVHKSQGSEYESVLLVLPNTDGLAAKDHPLLSREILYTGFTRAKKQVFLFGDEALLRRGVQKVHQRQSGPEILF